MQVHDRDKFGNFTILHEVEKSKDGHRQFLCRCDCGKEQIVYLTHLKNGQKTKCKECSIKGINKKHGLKNTRLYRIWSGMKVRCNCNTNKDAKNYHDRGIRVCQEWNDNFVNFYNWAINNGYSENLTIERINVDGNYCPENCTWIPKEAQQKNKTTNILINYEGHTITASELGRIVGISSGAMIQRIKRHGVEDKRIYQKQWRA